MVLITTLIHGWYTKQIDFVLAYTQADVECELYMAIPKGFEVEGEAQDYVLKLKKNLFGQKQAGRVWNQHLVDKLKEVGFIPRSQIDECLFYKGKLVFVLYTEIPFWQVQTLKSWTTLFKKWKQWGSISLLKETSLTFLESKLTESMTTLSISHSLISSMM
jgi:hypothetical protein